MALGVRRLDNVIQGINRYSAHVLGNCYARAGFILVSRTIFTAFEKGQISQGAKENSTLEQTTCQKRWKIRVTQHSP